MGRGPQGHEFTETNTIIDKSSGARRCFICEKKRWTAANRRAKEKKKWVTEA